MRCTTLYFFAICIQQVPCKFQKAKTMRCVSSTYFFNADACAVSGEGNYLTGFEIDLF